MFQLLASFSYMGSTQSTRKTMHIKPGRLLMEFCGPEICYLVMCRTLEFFYLATTQMSLSMSPKKVLETMRTVSWKDLRGIGIQRKWVFVNENALMYPNLFLGSTR